MSEYEKDAGFCPYQEETEKEEPYTMMCFAQ